MIVGYLLRFEPHGSVLQVLHADALLQHPVHLLLHPLVADQQGEPDSGGLVVVDCEVEYIAACGVDKEQSLGEGIELLQYEYFFDAIDLYDTVYFIFSIVLIGIVIPCELDSLYLDGNADHVQGEAADAFGDVDAADEWPGDHLVDHQVQEAGGDLLLEEGESEDVDAQPQVSEVEDGDAEKFLLVVGVDHLEVDVALLMEGDDDWLGDLYLELEEIEVSQLGDEDLLLFRLDDQAAGFVLLPLDGELRELEHHAGLLALEVAVLPEGVAVGKAQTLGLLTLEANAGHVLAVLVQQFLLEGVEVIGHQFLGAHYCLGCHLHVLLDDDGEVLLLRLHDEVDDPAEAESGGLRLPVQLEAFVGVVDADLHAARHFFPGLQAHLDLVYEDFLCVEEDGTLGQVVPKVDTPKDTDLQVVPCVFSRYHPHLARFNDLVDLVQPRGGPQLAVFVVFEPEFGGQGEDGDGVDDGDDDGACIMLHGDVRGSMISGLIIVIECQAMYKQEMLYDIFTVVLAQMKLILLEDMHSEVQDLTLPNLHPLPSGGPRPQLRKIDLMLKHNHVVFPALEDQGKGRVLGKLEDEVVIEGDGVLHCLIAAVCVAEVESAVPEDREVVVVDLAEGTEMQMRQIYQEISAFHHNCIIIMDGGREGKGKK